MNAAGSDHVSSRLLCSVDEVASLLGAKRTFVLGLIASGQLPSVKLGRLRKVAQADLEHFVERLRSEASAASDASDTERSRDEERRRREAACARTPSQRGHRPGALPGVEMPVAPVVDDSQNED